MMKSRIMVIASWLGIILSTHLLHAAGRGYLIASLALLVLSLALGARAINRLGEDRRDAGEAR